MGVDQSRWKMAFVFPMTSSSFMDSNHFEDGNGATISLKIAIPNKIESNLGFFIRLSHPCSHGIFSRFNTPTLKKNLLFVGQMMEKNIKLVFDNKECLIMDKLNKNANVARGEMTIEIIFKLIFPQVSHIV